MKEKRAEKYMKKVILCNLSAAMIYCILWKWRAHVRANNIAFLQNDFSLCFFAANAFSICLFCIQIKKQTEINHFEISINDLKKKKKTICKKSATGTNNN